MTYLSLVPMTACASQGSLNPETTLSVLPRVAQVPSKTSIKLDRDRKNMIRLVLREIRSGTGRGDCVDIDG